ncbi:MAG TPA: hypothetical protein VIK80_01985 [Flavihumibacter sp.]|jgi:hypothetical protein
MPNLGFIINLIDQLTFVVLLLSVLLLISKKAWNNYLLLFVGLNSLYSVLLFIVGWIYNMSSPQYELIANLSIHIDTITGLGVLFHLWPDERYRKFLVFSVIPVLLIWVVSLLFRGPQQTYIYNLITPAAWFLVASIYSMSLLYKRSFYGENAHYLSKFLFIGGFLFYNFIYLISEGCYILFANTSAAQDAWNINYCGYFIFRTMMLVGLVAWYYQPAMKGSLITIKR